MTHEKLLTTEEAADLLRIHPYTLTRMARDGEIKACKVARSWRFTHEELDAFLQRNQQKVSA